MSLGKKILLGVAATAVTIYGSVVAHRAITKPSIEKVGLNFSEIFRRDISKDQAQAMVNNYKDIFKIDNYKEFCTKLFEQVKKDYGYENVDIKLLIKDLPDGEIKTILDNTNLASYSSRKGVVTLRPVYHIEDGAMLSSAKMDMFTSLMHEFQHAKQSEWAYRTDSAKYIEAIKKGATDNLAERLIKQLERTKNNSYKLKEYMNKSKITSEEKAKENIDAIIKNIKNNPDYYNNGTFTNVDATVRLNDIWGNLKKFEKGSDEYNKGLQYIENAANYTHPDGTKETYDVYRAQILEQEAFNAQDKAQEIFNYFGNIWRIF